MALSGSGKSTFLHHLEQKWLESMGPWLPIRINLGGIHKPEESLLEKWFSEFSKEELTELVGKKYLILLLDG